MYEVLIDIFGEGKELSAKQTAARAMVIFLICILFIRLAGRRLGINTAFDTVISVLIGAVMSRAITGVSDFWPTCAAGFALVVLHRIFAWWGFYSRFMGKVMKGSPLLLYEDGTFLKGNMFLCCITENDLQEAIREQTRQDSFDKIFRIYAERNGSISIIMRNKST